MLRVTHRTTKLAVVGALWVLLALALSAPRADAATPADDAPAACLNGQGIVSTTLPAYARQSIGVEVGIGVADPTRVSDVSLSVFQGASLVSSTPLTLSSSATVQTVTAPTTGTTMTALVTWVQDAGTPAACSGVDLDAIPLISAYGSAGDPAQPRLAGSFNVVEQAVNYHAASTRAQWLFNSACVYFACGAYLQSSGGIELPLSLLASGAYQGTSTYGPALTATSCRTGGSHPVKLKNAYTLTEAVTVTVTGAANGAVSQISGTLTGTYTPTSAARHRGCVARRRTIERFTGQTA